MGDGLHRGAVGRDEPELRLMQRHVMRSPGQSHFPGEPNLLALDRHIILANHRTGGLVRGVAAGKPDQQTQTNNGQ